MTNNIAFYDALGAWHEAGCRFDALQYLSRATARDTALANALAVIDPEQFERIEAELVEARRESELTSAVLEYERRAREAGAASRAMPCVCGHSASVRHAAVLTDDFRLPCGDDGCGCEDATFTRSDSAVDS